MASDHMKDVHHRRWGVVNGDHGETHLTECLNYVQDRPSQVFEDTEYLKLSNIGGGSGHLGVHFGQQLDTFFSFLFFFKAFFF